MVDRFTQDLFYLAAGAPRTSPFLDLSRPIFNPRYRPAAQIVFETVPAVPIVQATVIVEKCPLVEELAIFSSFRSLPLSVVLVLACTAPAVAHTGALTVGGFFSGFTHPLQGLDHALAMVAVGIWGAYLGPPSIWTLPIVFPTIMAIGGAMGIIGIPVPPVEMMIALSGVVLGLLIVFAVRLPTEVAAVIVGVFAIFHGYAHGQEMPQAVSPGTYAFGFVVSTGLLHAAGICFSLLRGVRFGDYIVRTMGGAICLGGVAFLTGLAT